MCVPQYEAIRPPARARQGYATLAPLDLQVQRRAWMIARPLSPEPVHLGFRARVGGREVERPAYQLLRPEILRRQQLLDIHVLRDQVNERDKERVVEAVL